MYRAVYSVPIMEDLDHDRRLVRSWDHMQVAEIDVVVWEDTAAAHCHPPKACNETGAAPTLEHIAAFDFISRRLGKTTQWVRDGHDLPFVGFTWADIEIMAESLRFESPTYNLDINGPAGEYMPRLAHGLEHEA